MGESMKKPAPPKVHKFPAVKQRRLDHLLEKSSEGTITLKEKEVLEQLVAEAQELMVANAKRLADFSKGHGARPPAGSVPVTVWVQPQKAKR
jgi:hypothetical protein